MDATTKAWPTTLLGGDAWSYGAVPTGLPLPPLGLLAFVSLGEAYRVRVSLAVRQTLLGPHAPTSEGPVAQAELHLDLGARSGDRVDARSGRPRRRRGGASHREGRSR